MQLGLIRALTRSGLLFLAAWGLFFFLQLRRLTNVGEQPFAGIWDQRIEVISFVVLPPNVLMLVPATACAIVASVLAAEHPEIGPAILLRLSRWSANVMIAIAAISIVSILVNEWEGPVVRQDIGQRVVGLLVGVALSTLCRSVERSSPTG